MSLKSWWERFCEWLLANLASSLLEAGLPMPSSTSSFLLKPQDDITTKADRIQTCLEQTPVNLWELRELALSRGGLLTPKWRQKAWPLLVGLESNPLASSCTASISTSDNTTGAGIASDENDNFSPRNTTSPSRSVPVGTTTTTTAPAPAPALSDTTNTSKGTSTTTKTILEEKKKIETYEASMDLIKRDVGRSVIFRYKEDKPIPSYASERLAQALEDTIQPYFCSSNNATTGTSPGRSPKALLLRPPRSSRNIVDVSFNQQQQQQDHQEHHAYQPQQQLPPHYHYFQGLHDVAGVVLHQVDYQADLCACILQRLAQSHWRDALRENFGNLTFVLSLCLPLLEKIEPFVHYQLMVAQVEMSNLILPWMITWFTHDIFDADTAARLVDAFMASHPLMPLYFSVALLTHPRCKPLILQADPNDPASLFVTLKQLPKSICSDETVIISNQNPYDRRVTVQELLDDALSILQKVPPRSLLELVDPQLSPRATVLQRANTISMFHAARSWNLATYPNSSSRGSSTPTSARTNVSSSDTLVPPRSVVSLFLGPSTTHAYIRAKLASGVPLLITVVGPQWNMVRRRLRRQRRLQQQRPVGGPEVAVDERQ